MTKQAPGYIDNKEKVKNRLRRIAGQTRHCVVGAETPEAREEKTEEMMAAVGRLLKSR